MNRVLSGTLLASAVAVTVSACDAGVSGYVGPTADCTPYLSCETCTPIVGCGWCTAPGGGGVCASDPDYCPTQEFSWTWDIKGCRVAADASVVSLGDAGPDASEPDVIIPADGARDGAREALP
jgi:hypothetical protein